MWTVALIVVEMYVGICVLFGIGCMMFMAFSPLTWRGSYATTSIKYYFGLFIVSALFCPVFLYNELHDHFKTK